MRATVHPLPQAPADLGRSPGIARHRLRAPTAAAAAAEQDEEDSPSAPPAGADMAGSAGGGGGGGSRARARWLLACTLGRNPAAAAYRQSGGDTAAAGPRQLTASQAAIAIAPEANLPSLPTGALALGRDGPGAVETGANGPRLPTLRTASHAAI